MNGKDESVPEEESDLSDQDVDFYGTPGAESSFISDAKFGFVFFFFLIRLSSIFLRLDY